MIRTAETKRHIFWVTTVILLTALLGFGLLHAEKAYAADEQDNVVNEEPAAEEPTSEDADSEMKTVYVLTKVKEGKWSETNKYNEDGLVNKLRSDFKVKYDAQGNLSQIGVGSSVYYKYKWSNEGKLVQFVEFDRKHKVSYNAKGRVSKLTGSGRTITYKYNKKGQVISVTDMYNTKSKTKCSYAYDGHGNIKKMTVKGGYGKNKWTDKVTYKNTYKNNRLIKRKVSQNDGKTTMKYTYKAIQVKAENLEKVEAQQWSMLNDDLNFVLPML